MSKQRIPVGEENRLIFETKDEKTFKVFVDDKWTVIKRSDLMGLLFLFADKKEQEDLITTTEVKMKPIARHLTFTLKEDLKAGERVSAWYQYLLPVNYANKLIAVNPRKYKEATINIVQVQKELTQIEL